MKKFFKEMMEAQRESNAITKAFIKNHPVGYGIYLTTALALSLSPLIYYKVKDKIEEKKNEKWLEDLENED